LIKKQKSQHNTQLRGKSEYAPHFHSNVSTNIHTHHMGYLPPPITPQTIAPLIGKDKIWPQQPCRMSDKHNLPMSEATSQLDDWLPSKQFSVHQLEVKLSNSNQHELIEAHSESSSTELGYPNSEEGSSISLNPWIEMQKLSVLPQPTHYKPIKDWLQISGYDPPLQIIIKLE